MLGYIPSLTGGRVDELGKQQAGDASTLSNMRFEEKRRDYESTYIYEKSLYFLLPAASVQSKGVPFFVL